MSADLISVIVPAYNHEKYIEECIRSVMAQTYQNIELLVIDDGSKDGTFDVLQRLKPECEKRFVRVVMETQENQGIKINLNRLIDLAQGEYIYDIASDDVSKPHAIETLHAFLSEHPDYVLAVGDNEIINGRSERIYWGKNRKDVPKAEAVAFTLGDEIHLNPPLNDHPDFGSYAELLKGNYIPNGYLERRQAIIDAGKYNPDIFLEDWYMNLQLSKLGRFKYIPEILYSYRWHNENTVLSQEYQQKQTEICRQIWLYEKDYAFANGHQKLWQKMWSKRFGWRGKWKKIRNFIRGRK